MTEVMQKLRQQLWKKKEDETYEKQVIQLASGVR